MIGRLIYDTSFPVVLAACMAVGLAFAFGCLGLVHRVTTAETRGRHSDLVSFTATNIAVLYSVLLAFLAVAAWEGFGKASDAASTEASLVSNLYHDSQGMAAPLNADLRTHVLAYLRRIIDVEWPAQARGEIPSASEKSLVDLHRHIARLSPADNGDTVLMGDMLRVLNQIDTAREARIEAQGGHIPALLWAMLMTLGLLTIAISTFIPAENAAVQAVTLGSLVFSIVIVLVIIVELDNPFRGSIAVDDQPYRQVLDQIQQPEPPDDSD